MPKCPDIEGASSGCFSSDSSKKAPLFPVNRWIAVVEKGPGSADQSEDTKAALDHFVGEGWSNAVISSDDPLLSVPEGYERIGPLPNFDFPVTFMRLEFEYSGPKSEIDWPWLQCFAKPVCIGLVAFEDQQTEADKKAAFFERLRQSKKTSPSKECPCPETKIASAQKSGKVILWGALAGFAVWRLFR